jgi:hypothetical protein
VPPRLTADAIVARLAAAKGEVKATLLESLARDDPRPHLDLYAAALSDESPAVRACALRVIGNVGDGRFLPPLVAAVGAARCHDEAEGYEKPALAVCTRVQDKRGCAAAIAATIGDATPAGKCSLLRLLARLGGGEAASAARKVLTETRPGPENIARQAKASASSELKKATAASFAIDGRVPDKGSQADDGAAWAAGGKAPLPITFTLEWDQPVRIAEVVYYGRTAWSNQESWKEYEVYLDDSGTAAAKGRFAAVHGPQGVRLAKAATARRLVLKFLSSHGGANPGASEIKVFSEPVEDLDAAEVRAAAEGALASLAGGRPAGTP